MSILSTIQADVKDAMKARDAETTQTLRLLVNALQNAAKDAGTDDLADDEAIQVLTRQKKQCVEAAEAFEGGGAEERAAAERAQIEMIDRYLPAQLGEDELAELVAAAISETGATAPKDMGQVMKALMPKVQGRADGKAVSQAVQSRLASGA